MKVDRSMIYHYVYPFEFCAGFWEKVLELIEFPKYVHMLGIAMFLDGMHRSVKSMEPTWVPKLGTTESG